MTETGPDYLALAASVDEMSTAVGAIVARLISDGFSEEQARTITTAMLASMGRGESDD